MPAATATDLTTTDRSTTDSLIDRSATGYPRHRLAAGPDAAERDAPTGPAAPGAVAGRDASTSSVTVTLRIDLRGEKLPPEVAGLLETVAALAGRPTVGGGQAANDPAVADGPGAGAPIDGRTAWPRPRLVRGAEPPAAVPVLRIYLDSRLVSRAGMPIRLTRREYDLLTFLCEHPRRVFSRGQLMRQVWGHEMVGGERTVDVHVRRLRVKLGEPGPVISTVRGVGYRLDDVASVAIVGGSR